MLELGNEWNLFTSRFILKETVAPIGGEIIPNAISLYAKDKAGTSALYLKDDAGNEREISPTTAITGTGVSGQVTFWTGATTISGDNAFGWDNVNKRAGIGTLTPTVPFDVLVTATADGGIKLRSAASDSLSINVQNSVSVGRMFIAGGASAFIPGTVAGDFGLRVGDSNSIFFGKSTIPYCKIDTNAKMWLGTSFTNSHTGTDGFLDLENDNSNTILSINTHNVGANAYIFAHRSRGTHASPTVVADGDTVFGILGKGYGGVSYHDVARIFYQVDGTPGNNDMPGRIVFSVTPDGTATLAEAFRINNAKAWGLSGATFGTSGNLVRSNGSAAAVSWQDHTADFLSQYALLAGRSGGQTLIGGTAANNKLVLQSTSNATRGDLDLDAADLTFISTMRARMSAQNRFRYLNSMVMAYKTSNQTGLTINTWNTITLQAEEFDTDGLHNNSSNTSRLTAGLSGKYLVTGAAYIDETNITGRTNAGVRILKNGSTAVVYADNVSETGTNLLDPTLVATGIVELSAGDYVELQGIGSGVSGTFDISDVSNLRLTRFGMIYIGE